MELFIGLFILVPLILIIMKLVGVDLNADMSDKKPASVYFYDSKEAVMTKAEASFYRQLEQVVNGKYYIFPQIHLSALLINRTKGRYWRAAFQRINRISVDYVLCDKETMSPVYAVELDDITHDTEKRRARDTGVEQMLADINLPLVRFRNVGAMTDEQISQKFEEAARTNLAPVGDTKP